MGHNDYRAKSFSDLMNVLYDIPKTQYGRYRSNLVYRGVADKAWGLDSSLNRLGPHFAEVEEPLLRTFTKYAQPGNIPSHALLFRLALAQHHGLPTSLGLEYFSQSRAALCHL
jgi:hypothetical protein